MTDHETAPIAATLRMLLEVARAGGRITFSDPEAPAVLRAAIAALDERDEALARVRELEGQVIALAKLASDTPQFFNPLHAMAAQDLRDRILAAGCPAEEGEAT